MSTRALMVAGDSSIESRPPATGYLATETDDPANGLLDALETLISTMAALGMDSQIRARLARLLPPPVVRPDGAAGTQRALMLAAVLSALVIVRNRRLTEAEARAVSAAKDWIKTELNGATA